MKTKISLLNIFKKENQFQNRELKRKLKKIDYILK